jgi:NAD+ synthase (glutamine-hydrolysing)
MIPIKVATASLNQTPLDWAGNQRRIEGVLRQAQAEGVTLLVLPELCTTGYGCEDAFLGPDVAKRAWSMMTALLPQTKGMLVSMGMPVRRRGGLYNTACVIADGRIAGFAAKEHLAGEGLHYEPRWFKPWPNHQVVQLERDGQSYPFGDVFFDFSGVRIGFEICEDAWVAQRRGALDGHAMDIIVNPSASHFAFGKHEIRERLVLEGSRSMAVIYLYANLLGNEAGRVIYDGGCYIAQNGKLLAQAPRLTFADSVLTTAVVDVEASRTEQVRTTSFQADSTDPGVKRIVVDFEFPTATMERTEPSAPKWEESGHHKEEEFMRALTLGLFDYLRKSHSRGFVLSISGGADSAAAACLVSLMVDRALQDRQQHQRHERSGYESGGGDWRHVLRARRATHRRSIRAFDRRGRGAPAHMGARRHHPAKHPSPRPGTKRMDARQHARRIAPVDEQSLRGCGRLRDDGWRHLRRPEPDRRHRQGVPPPLASLARNQGAPRHAADSGFACDQRPDPHRGAPSTGQRPNR